MSLMNAVQQINAELDRARQEGYAAGYAAGHTDGVRAGLAVHATVGQS